MDGVNNFGGLVKKLLKKKEEEWRERMEKKSKLRLYIQLKSKLVMEEYVSELDRSKRKQLAMLRGGTNYLRIERGRWVGEEVEERVCRVCLCDDVEDEKHFLLACPMQMFRRISWQMRIPQKSTSNKK